MRRIRSLLRRRGVALRSSKVDFSEPRLGRLADTGLTLPKHGSVGSHLSTVEVWLWSTSGVYVAICADHEAVFIRGYRVHRDDDMYQTFDFGFLLENFWAH